MEAHFNRRGRVTALIVVEIRGFVESVVGGGVVVSNNHGLRKRVDKFRKSSIISGKPSPSHLSVQSSVALTILLLLPYKVRRIPFMS